MRSSAASRPSSGLEVDHAQAGLQPLPRNEGLEVAQVETLHNTLGPQTIPQANKEAVNPNEGHRPHEGNGLFPANEQEPLKRRDSRKRRRKWIIIAAVLAVVMIALAVGLGVGLTRNDTSDSLPNNLPSSNIPSSTPSDIPNEQGGSRSGAYNLTSIATLAAEDSQTHLFYQNYKGEIHLLDGNYRWNDSLRKPILEASDVRNATPLAAANYTTGEMHFQYLFYVDKQNTLQELISIDNFTTSEKGTLGSLAKEVVPTAKSLAALYNDGMFYVHNESRAGIRLFYGDVDGQVHEVDYLTSSEKWSPGNFSFEVTNGNGGMALDFIDRGGPGVVHLFVLNDANELRLWYNIFSNTTSTTANPDGIGNITYGQWAQDNSAAPITIAANSSLAYSSGYVFFQQPSGAVTGVEAFPTNITGTWGTSVNVGSSSAAYAELGSSISAAWMPVGGSSQYGVHVFYQLNATDVTMNIDTGGEWTFASLPVE